MALLVYLYFCIGAYTIEISPKISGFEARPPNRLYNNATDKGTRIIDDSLKVNESLQFEHNCQAKFTSFANEKNICGAKNIQEFLTTSKEQYTCAGRCGQKATYGKPEECSCDATCVVFHDCCGDFAETCTEFSYESKTISSHLHGVSVACNEESFGVILNDDKHDNPSTTDFRTTVYSTTVDFFTPVSTGAVRTQTNLPKILRDAYWGITDYKVLDPTLGVIFNNYISFYKWRLPGSKKEPTFLPIIRAFQAVQIYDKIPEHSSVIDLMSRSIRDKVSYPATTFNRNCPRYDVVSCYCDVAGGDTKQYLDLRRDACTGGRKNVPLSIRNKTLFEILKVGGFGESLDKELEDKECFSSSINLINPGYKKSNIYKGLSYKIANPSFKQMDKPGNAHVDYMDYLESSFKIITTPTILKSPRHSENGKLNSGTESSHREVIRELGEDVILNLDAVEFVIEMTKTIERRIRCPSFITSLRNCTLDICAPGVIMWPGAPHRTTGLFQNGACMSPVKAAVGTEDGHISRVPACTCMRVMMAMLAMGLWDIALDRSSQSPCAFKMKARPTQMETTDFDDRVYDGTPMDYSSMASSSSKETQILLQDRLFESQSTCPQDEVYWLQICLYDRENRTLSDCQIALRVFAGLPGQEKNTATIQKIYNLFEDNVILGTYIALLFLLAFLN